MQRERLGSRLGFIMLSAGCAIGIGNVWKFPYIVGQYGGGIFVLIYIIFLIAIGVPVMTMEFAIGRASRKSPVKMYRPLEPPKTKWHLHGYVALAGNYILMMFYTCVAGWMLNYFVNTATGKFVGLNPEQIKLQYTHMQSDAFMMMIYTSLVIIIGFAVCSLGLQNGLERITKIMMILLLAIMVVLAVNSLLITNGREGLKFYLIPDFEKIKEVGIVNVVVAAMNQAFFTLSLGIGGMAVFGSYIDKKRSLLGESINVAVLDTFVAFVSGLIVFPACSAYNVEVDSGPTLIFVTLPNIFNNLPMGRLWGSLFFVFMCFAALSTVFAVFEVIISSTIDIFNCSRKKACVVNCIAILILSLPCILGFNVLSGIKPFGDGSTIMDLEDFIINNLLIPLGSLVIVLFCVLKKGWGWDNFIKEANSGKGIKIPNKLKGYITFVLPIVISVLFVFGLYNFFVAS